MMQLYVRLAEGHNTVAIASYYHKAGQLMEFNLHLVFLMVITI